MQKTILCILCFSLFIIVVNSCRKGTPAPQDPCRGTTIAVNGTATTTSSAAASDGSIAATATGASGFTFSINNGAFQSSGNFTGLAAGSYTITAKSSAGCTGTRSFSVTAGNICAGVSIIVTATASGATPCTTPANGTITVTATGSSGFTYSIDGTNYLASGNFANVSPGTYSVTAKDANGCTGTSNVTVTAAAAGPLFTAVKGVLQANCQSCHNATQSEGGMNWTVDCNIVSFRDRIKVRAVDLGTMPPTGPLPASEKNKITAWINAGGRYTD